MDDKLLKELISYLENLHHVHGSDLPSLELYMDQVTGFMEEHLSSMRRYEEDKALTKTMINNYAKNHILPPPVRKRYNKNHTLILLFIYYYKSMLSLSDIETILHPLNENYFHNKTEPKLKDIYEEVFSFANVEMQNVIEDVKESFQKAQTSFSEKDPHFETLSIGEREDLQQFCFFSLLAFEVYLKKQLLEKMVDAMAEKQNKKEKKRK